MFDNDYCIALLKFHQMKYQRDKSQQTTSFDNYQKMLITKLPSESAQQLQSNQLSNMCLYKEQL